MAISNVVGHKVEMGPIKMGPIPGDKIQEYPTPMRDLTRSEADLEGRSSGFSARVITPGEIVLYEFNGPIRWEREHIIGEQINRHHITKHHFYYSQ